MLEDGGDGVQRRSWPSRWPLHKDLLVTHCVPTHPASLPPSTRPHMASCHPSTAGAPGHAPAREQDSPQGQGEPQIRDQLCEAAPCHPCTGEGDPGGWQQSPGSSCPQPGGGSRTEKGPSPVPGWGESVWPRGCGSPVLGSEGSTASPPSASEQLKVVSWSCKVPGTG